MSAYRLPCAIASSRRYTFVPSEKGLRLLPLGTGSNFTQIELGDDGSIRIDGTGVTGSQLRDRLGADADLIMGLSYVDAATRKRVFGFQ